MSTITKWILRAVGFLASCILIVILGFTLLVDPNNYASDLELAAQKNGLALKIEGDISWSFFPRPGCLSKILTLTMLSLIKDLLRLWLYLLTG